MDWIYVIAGALSSLVFCAIMYVIGGAKLDSTICITLDANEFQCLHCGAVIKLERGTYDLHYCPHCGKQVKKVIDK